MRNPVYLILLMLITVSCGQQFEPLSDYPNEHLLISAEELHNQIQDNDLMVIDARSEIENGVIQGAVHFPAVSSLADPDHDVEHFLVGPEKFQEMMRQIGLNNGDRVVIYDEGNSLASARLFYALEYYGFSEPSVVNGGMQGWLAAELPLDESPVQKEQGDFSFDIQEGLTCNFNYVMEAADSPDKIILDARSADEHTGKDKRAERAGHIPNAVNIEWSRVLEEEGVPYFQPAASIQAIYAAMGITPDKEVIPHCHTNVRGSHAYFTLRLMGYDSVRPYEGSWSEYGNREDAVIRQ